MARVGDGRGDFGSRGLAAPYRTPLYQFVCLCLRHACTVVAPPLNGRWSRARVRPRQRSVCNTCAASAGDDARGAADSVNWYPPRASCPPPSVVELRSPLREQRTRDGSFRIRVYINLPSQWSYPSCATLCTTDLLLKPAQPLTIFGMQRLIHVVVRRRKAVTVQAWLTIKINPLGLCAAGGQ